MTIVYKVQGYDLTTSTLTTVLTIDASSRAIVKEITVANDTVSSTEVNLYVRDSSVSTDYKFYHIFVPANNTEYAVNNTLVLEEGDSLKFQSATGNAISGQISYALINRSDQNG
jgi:hypothetical protein